MRFVGKGPMARLRRFPKRRAHKSAHPRNTPPTLHGQAQVCRSRKALDYRLVSECSMRRLGDGDVRSDGMAVYAPRFQAPHSLPRHKGLRARRLAHYLRRPRTVLRAGGIRDRRIRRPEPKSLCTPAEKRFSDARI